MKNCGVQVWDVSTREYAGDGVGVGEAVGVGVGVETGLGIYFAETALVFLALTVTDVAAGAIQPPMGLNETV